MSSTTLIFAFLTIFGYSIISGIYCEEVEVTLRFGTVRGYKHKVDEKYVNAFLGIPYAEPPIGDLRFRKPIPISKKWSAPLNANKLPKHCIQKAVFIQPDDEISEDCLYLNIWTAVKLDEDFSQSLTPVMIFQHPGLYNFMGSQMKHFNGSVLSSFGDVVVVTFNYRLGAFGFLTTGNVDAPGNVGLYDQALALEWVQENIAYFGGDPNKVTFFGESSGGIGISLHLISPVVYNTFNRAIMMSGPSFLNIAADTKEAGIKKAMKLAELVGCGNKDGINSNNYVDIECLRKVDSEKIMTLQASQEISRLSTCLMKAWFLPVFGEPFLPMKPKEMLQSGHLKKGIDLLVGSTSDEGHAVHFLLSIIDASPKGENWQQKLESVVTEYFEDISDEEKEMIIAFYFNDVDNKSSDEAKQAYSAALGDIYFNCEAVYFNDFVSKFSNLYQYLFEYVISNVNDRLSPCYADKSCHTDDVPFTFGTVSDPKDIKASKKWMKIMTHFAKTGTTEWPKHANKSRPYYVFTGDESRDRVEHNFRSDVCKLWKPLLERNY